MFFRPGIPGFSATRAARILLRESFAVAWVLATLATCAGALVISEATSLFNALTPGFCRTLWILADIALLPAVFAFGNGRHGASVRERLREFHAGFPVKSLMLASVAFILMLGVFAIETPTTVWDCQTYHLPRIMHWFQQCNLNPYPTNIPRQINYPPGGEIIAAQLMLLSGDDLPANLPQWWALGTAALIAMFLTRECSLWQSADALPGRQSPRRFAWSWPL